MAIDDIVLGVIVLAFVAAIIVAQIRAEGRARRREQEDRDREDMQRGLSHEQAKDREWWI